MSSSFASFPSVFGGNHDVLILRAETSQFRLHNIISVYLLLIVALTGEYSDGYIHAWDRTSAEHLFRLDASRDVIGGELTSFSWNRGSKEYMFATGTDQGQVHIWTQPYELDTSEPTSDSGVPPASEANE